MGSKMKKVIYICSFDLKGGSGKERATKQKLKALSKLCDLKVLSLKINKFKLIQMLFIDLYASLLLLMYKPNIIISRGYVGFLPQLFSKLLKIKSMREVHGDILGEIPQLNKSKLVKALMLPLGHLSNKIDNNADVRIFNHPYLKEWFAKKYSIIRDNDIVSYNGYSFDAKSKGSKQLTREKFNFASDKRYFVFTGAASYWHGVDYLVSLQKELCSIGSNIVIVCGGGEVINNIDDGNKTVLTNITPLDAAGCADLICAADACLLPVRNSRVSPGNPLKMYDYILHNKFIIVQKNLVGYSDEVVRYGYGLEVDFEDAKQTAIKINALSNSVLNNDFISLNREFSWDGRVGKWIR